jgi:type II secretory pathway component PulF
MSFIVTPRQFAQRAEFYHQLAQLTSAGIGVLPALEQLKLNPPARSYREPIQRLLAELAQGRTLTGSLQQLDAWLTPANTAGGSTPVSACSPIITTTRPASPSR